MSTWSFVIAISSGVMPFASACSMSAPAATSVLADSIRPSRAAYSSGVSAPGMRYRDPRSGSPPRTMPMPWPKPGTELGSTHGGVGPVRVCALTSARRSTSSFTTSG